MQYIVNRGEKGKIEIKVDVPKSGFEEAYTKIVGELGKDANIAGFRPGMAPVGVVEQHVGYNKILNQAASLLISKHLSEIFKKEDLVPLDSPKIAVETLSKDAPFAFAVTFTQKPKVKVGDWKKIKVAKVKATEITDKDVEESIKNIFEAWLKQKGQRDKEPKETQKKEESGKFIYDARGNKVFFDKKTLRSSSSQDSTAGLRIPIRDDKGSSSTNAQDEIDDEFARAIGARDLAHLKEIVKKDLETIVADSAEAKFEQEIFGKILELGSVEAPEILVEDELNRMLVRLNAELERQGGLLEKYLEEQKVTLDQLKAKWRDQAEKNVKTSLILEQIGKDEQIKVEREEVDKALTGVNQTDLSEEQKADLEKYIVFSIFQAKTLDLVKKTVSA